MAILENFQHKSWHDLFDRTTQERAISALENGKILFFPNLQFELKSSELPLLSPHFSDGKAKNISFDLKKNKLQGMDCTETEKTLLKGMMERFNIQATTLLHDLIPTYTSQLQVARTSYRPTEIFGRKSPSYRKDDTRLHVDAFPANPNQGKRILRVFSNINPNGQDRVWRAGEPFEKVAKQFLPQVSNPLFSRWLLQKFKITKSYRTLYDHIMLQIHNLMKANLDYQKNAEQVEVRFPPGSTWIVFTDVVSHAAMSGQFALEQTFSLPVEGMGDKELSPLRQLERLVNKSLVT